MKKYQHAFSLNIWNENADFIIHSYKLKLPVKKSTDRQSLKNFISVTILKNK